MCRASDYRHGTLQTSRLGGVGDGLAVSFKEAKGGIGIGRESRQRVDTAKMIN
jgi:hypothetical protein